MKEISTIEIITAVKKMCIDANYFLSSEVTSKITECYVEEKWPVAHDILGKILENIEIAKEDQVPICQDTGIACVFIEMGQEVHIIGGSLEDAINEGVRQGYTQGYLRKSVVLDPINRINSNDNTPAVINYKIVPGHLLKIKVAPKGFGSENMSQLKMLKPSDGIEGVKKFIMQVIKEAGPNPCPPIVVGIGIGGTFDRVAYLAKCALVRPLDQKNPNPFYSDLEELLLKEINLLGIGPQGLGGKTTALAVNIETYPTHIAGLPVAVNINCHVTRHAQIVLGGE